MEGLHTSMKNLLITTIWVIQPGEHKSRFSGIYLPAMNHHQPEKPELLPLQWVDRIEFIRASEEGEGKQVDADQDAGRESGLQKVKITYNTNPGSFPEIVYLAITRLRWKNKDIKAFF